MGKIWTYGGITTSINWVVYQNKKRKLKNIKGESLECTYQNQN